jgi:hypothetical protein
MTESLSMLDSHSSVLLELMFLCVSWWFISLFNRRCRSELPWYFVWQLTQNYLIVWDIWCKIIFLFSRASHVDLSIYFVACHMVNILDFLFDSSTWIFLIFCWVSHRDLFHYSVGHLTLNCLDSISKESWLIKLIFYHTLDRRCWYFVWRHMVNVLDILSVVLRILWTYCQMSVGELSWYFVEWPA